MKAIESYLARKVTQERKRDLKMKPRLPRNHYTLVAMVQPRFVFFLGFVVQFSVPHSLTVCERSIKRRGTQNRSES
jgi:hypothetical protein